MTRKAWIAHLAGPNATIQNTPPLVTSNKARGKHNLPLLTHSDGTPQLVDKRLKHFAPAKIDYGYGMLITESDLVGCTGGDAVDGLTNRPPAHLRHGIERIHLVLPLKAFR